MNMMLSNDIVDCFEEVPIDRTKIDMLVDDMEAMTQHNQTQQPQTQQPASQKNERPSKPATQLRKNLLKTSSGKKR